MSLNEPKGPTEGTRAGDGELVLSFYTAVSSQDKLLLEAVIFVIYGSDAHLEIADGSSSKEVVIRGNQFKLNRIGDAFYHREWENNPEMQRKIDEYLRNRK